MKRILTLLLAAALLFCAVQAEGRSYRQIDQETALEMMARDDGHIVVDVRRQDEYDAGHIPGAILIPNETIGTERPEALPDLEQIILVYCRSGNRSKQASDKLAAMGYANVYEFGGINTWPGEVVPSLWTAAEMPVKVRYDRMWIYSAVAESEDPAVIAALVDAVKALTVGERTEMAFEDYTDLLTFTFEDGDTLRLEFEENVWVGDQRYRVEGLSDVRALLDNLI